MFINYKRELYALAYLNMSTASCKPGFRPGLQPGFRQVRAGLRHAFETLVFFCRKPGREPAASIPTCGRH